jgi:HEPN superfamily AbiU2-like protein
VSEQTADEVRKQFESHYPSGTGDLAYRLWNDLCLLHTTLATYLQLYSASNTVSTLNKTAPQFFAWLQGRLRVDLFLRIGRLTDPPQSGARGNVSLAALVSDLRSANAAVAADALLAGLAPLQPVVANVRKIRHRTLAHSDRKTVLREDSPLPNIHRQDLERLVEGLGEAFNEVDVLFRKSKTYFKGTEMVTGTEHLLTYLEKGHATFEVDRLQALGRGNE